jgi:predicted short-subunit dehydrogenase-like oxidoreductase (DUF2520 family)
MNISIIGSGNVATVLSKLAIKKGHFIKQIIARNEISGNRLATEVNASYISMQGLLDKNIDLCIICLSDNAFPEAIDGINFGSIPIFHSAGSVTKDVLSSSSKNYGVLYPLQSLRKEMETIPVIPFLIEANNDATFILIETFAKTLSDIVQKETEDKRLRLHASAVVVSNFTNYIYGMAETYCLNEKVDFSLLKPLIKETAERIQHNSPHAVQTGPAVRRDITTLEKHLQLFNPYPKMKILYTRMTDGIMNG